MDLREEIAGIIKDKVAQLCRIDKAELNMDTNLKTGLKLKSGDVVVVIAALEDEYDAYIDYMKLATCETVGQMADFVAKIIEG